MTICLPEITNRWLHIFDASEGQYSLASSGLLHSPPQHSQWSLSNRELPSLTHLHLPSLMIILGLHIVPVQRVGLKLVFSLCIRLCSLWSQVTMSNIFMKQCSVLTL